VSVATQTTSSVSGARSDDAGVDVVTHLTAGDFGQRYVAKRRAVLIKGALDRTAAFERWSFDHLRETSGGDTVVLKDFTPDGRITTQTISIGAYLDEIAQFEEKRAAGDLTCRRPAYLHDVPLTNVFRDAKADLAAFPHDFLPKWYGADWTSFAQFFLGPSTSVTPLHFDCLLTHNLFFQLRGRKRFTVLDHAELNKCYSYDWRWCAVDPEEPDYAKYPRYRNARAHEVLVEPGDVFFMPSGMLHHVRSLDAAMSFNIDWHTRGSALEGLLGVTRGMPLKTAYYNLVIAFGLWTGVSNQRLMPFYRSYLSYIS
jgi:ribosomal protein L16 Arg81 hydroxylase